MKKLLFIAIFLPVMLLSCRKEDITPVNDVTPLMARDSLYDIMNEWYYWYNLMPVVNKGDYTDPNSLLEAMRYKALDRWSFVADYDEFNAEMMGTFVGHGIRIGIDDADNARIAMIYTHAPLYANGVRRGWIIKKINNTDIVPIIKAGDITAYNELLKPAEAGITNIFTFQRPDGMEETISSTKAVFTVNTVLLYDTLHLSGGITGQLVFESFIIPSVKELETAFAFFKANNIEDLILDLRYNSGGYLDIAQTLASYIAGNSLTTTIFAKMQYNNKHDETYGNYFFKNTSYPLGLSRIVVITSRATASASEAVMNGLKPLVDIVSIGDTTNGKPTGMNGWDIGKKYWMWPVTFKIVNKNNEGEYFDGIFPDKLTPDDIAHDFNDRNEQCLKEAIYYLENGSVSGKGSPYFKSYGQFSERPGWMNNTFVK